jgi:dTDP-4-amino-4,6-dideoxygalactose transaminase/acetyltransferase-like isoleucine patch superfamily enzyme
MNPMFARISDDVRLGTNVKLSDFINLYGCEIGDDTKIGTFVEIQKHAKIGRQCKVSSHAFICEGVTIEDGVFVGHGVTFTNDRYPRSTNAAGALQTEADWKLEPTLVKRGASIGSGATILPQVIIGENAIVGAGSVVTKDVPANTVVAGNPARVLRSMKSPDPNSQAGPTLRVPFLDLIKAHKDLETDLLAVFKRALSNAEFVGGPLVEDFEHKFAEFCEIEHCVGVASGTDALRFALIAAGVKPGDLVITVPNTFIATCEAITQAGAVPRFVDIDERTYNMDPLKLQEYLNQCQLHPESGVLVDRKTQRPVTAIVPVHLYGQMAEMDSILEQAHRYHLLVIEDACQAQGAEYFSQSDNRWYQAGTMGQAGAFSFYPGKNLGACGEAGAVVTSDETLARKVQMLRDHGQAKKYYHQIEGYNGRLDAIQAGFLTVKLSSLPAWNELRRARAQSYGHLLAPLGEVVLPYVPAYSRPVYHLYAVRVQDRDQVRERLSQAGVGTGIHYPVPLHLQDAYRDLGYRLGDFPIAEKVAAEILSLPMYPQLTEHEQEYVAERLVESLTARSELNDSPNGNRRVPAAASRRV